MIRRRSYIRRGRRPRNKMPKALGDHRERVKYANELWRHQIYAKSKDGLCVRCRRRPFAQAMHIFPKGKYPHIRFELENGAPGCVPCHRHIDSDHEAKLEFAVQYLGEAGYAALKLRAIGRGKLDLALKIMQLERLKEI